MNISGPGLSARSVDEVIAFLFHLRHADDLDYQSTISRRLEDKDPTHWLSLDDFERELNK